MCLCLSIKQMVQAVVKSTDVEVLLIHVCTFFLQQKWPSSGMFIILLFEVSDIILAFCGSYVCVCVCVSDSCIVYALLPDEACRLFKLRIFIFSKYVVWIDATLLQRAFALWWKCLCSTSLIFFCFSFSLVMCHSGVFPCDLCFFPGGCSGESEQWGRWIKY